MRDAEKLALASLMVALVFGYSLASAAADKIVCWKDKSGKVIGCGDIVPPEYRDNATKELDKRGVTRKTTVSADEEARRKKREAELAKQRADEEKRITEQKRQDAALLGSFFTVKEIDDKRNWELKQYDQRISELQASLKNAHTDARKTKIQGMLEYERRERQVLIEKYAGYRKRFVELKGAQ